MTLFQKLILAFITILVAINIFYESGTNTSERLLNKSTWTKFSKEEEWTKLGSLEFKPYLVKVAPRLENWKFGWQFVYLLETRYFRTDTLLSKKIKTDFRPFSNADVWWLSKDKDGLHHLEDMITIDNGGSEFYNDKAPEYAFLNETKLSFITSFLPPKLIRITAGDHHSLMIRSNPLLIFQEDTFNAFFWVATSLLGLFVGFSGRGAYFVPMIALGFSSMGLDFSIWYFLVFVFIFSVIITIKMESTAFSGLIDLSIEKPLLSKILGIALYAFIVGYLFTWKLPSQLNFTVFLPFIFALFIEFAALLILFLSANLFHTLYLYFKYKKQLISTISFSNLRSNFDRDSRETGKRIPAFYADIVLNNTIKIKEANVSMVIYKKLKKGKQVSVRYFKTDDKGNYLFTN